MKIVVGDKVYVWKLVMAFIEHEFRAAPGALYKEFALRYPIHHITGPEDAAKFEYVFKNSDTVEYLQNADYIPDAEQYFQMSAKELQAIINDELLSFDSRSEKFDRNDARYKFEHEDEMNDIFDKTRLKCECLRLLIEIKKGRVAAPELPEDVLLDYRIEKTSLFDRLKNKMRPR